MSTKLDRHKNRIFPKAGLLKTGRIIVGLQGHCTQIRAVHREIRGIPFRDLFLATNTFGHYLR